MTDQTKALLLASQEKVSLKPAISFQFSVFSFQFSVLYKSFTILHQKEKNSKYSKLEGEWLKKHPSPSVHHCSSAGFWPC